MRKILVLLPLLPALAIPGLGTLIAAGLVIVALFAFSDARQATFTRGPWLRSLGIGAISGVAIAVLMGMVVNDLLAKLFGQASDFSAFNSVKGNTAEYVRLLLLGLVYGPVVEEIIFRGFVIGWGSKLFGQRATPLLALVSAAVFGITHWYQGWTGVCSTGIIGLGYGLVYIVSSRNIVAAIFTHMTLNAIGVTELYLGI
ncbi:MAG TPA: CPBP family intramembrane glutamic endopeptidase [Candidatus Acidoferrum sp.]|nr:CPBP family intramembrane glutamic endopeptidase [Candidatus Acidoferrum sp.]